MIADNIVSISLCFKKEKPIRMRTNSKLLIQGKVVLLFRTFFKILVFDTPYLSVGVMRDESSRMEVVWCVYVYNDIL